MTITEIDFSKLRGRQCVGIMCVAFGFVSSFSSQFIVLIMSSFEHVSLCGVLIGQLSATVIVGIGVFINLRAFCTLRKAICPACRNNLSYLFVDPSYSGLPGGSVLLPRIKRSEITCPYCGWKTTMCVPDRKKKK